MRASATDCAIKKQEIFAHLAESMLAIAKTGGFEFLEGENIACISGIMAPSFNFISFGSFESIIVQKLISNKTPFICIPQLPIESSFPNFCERNGLEKADTLVANEFEYLHDYHYEPNPRIKVERIHSEEKLKFFDKISATAFKQPEGYCFNFLRGILENNDFTLFLAYYDGIPAGCGMLSFVAQDAAGLYWDRVLPEFQGKGIATELVKYRMNFAKEMGFKRIRAQNISPSLGYYKRLGFKPYGTIPLYIYKGEALL